MGPGVLLLLWMGFAPDTLQLQEVPLEGKLPQLSVYSLAADSVGFIWMSTLEGIARWDGVSVRSWKSYYLPEGTEYPITALKLTVDRFQNVWVQAGSNLLLRTAQRDSFIITPYSSLAIAPDGSPWIWTACGPRPYVPNMQPACNEPASEPPPVWKVDAQQQIWWIRNNTLWCLADSKAVRPAVVATNLLLADRRGRLWLQQRDTLSAYQVQGTCRLTPLERIPFSAPINDVALDLYGRLWLATRSGVFVRIQPGKLQQLLIPFPYRTQLTRYVLSLAGDRQGRIWVGTVGGVYVWDPWRPSFRLIGRAQGLESGYVSAILQDRAGHLWVGTIGGGLFVFRLQEQDWRLERQVFLPNPFVWVLAEDAHGHHWIGTDQGLFCLECPRQLLPASPEVRTPGPNTFTALLTDGAALWAGSYTGQIYRIQNDAPQLLYEADAPVRSLLRDGDTLWVGLQDGLLRLVLHDEGRSVEARRESLPAPTVAWSQYRNARGHWLGTSRGLWLRQGTRWLHWDEADGLPSRTIYGLLADDRSLWLSTNRGLVRVFTDSLPRLRFRTYTTAEGLGATEFNRGAYYKDRAGRLYFGGTHGVVWFDPRTIRPYPFAPAPVMLSVLRAREARLVATPFDGRPIVLPPGERAIGLVFRGLFLSFPEGVRYRILMDGERRQTLDLGTSTQLVLSNLTPGTYRITVEAIGPDGQVGRLAEPIHLIARPHLWETTGFRVSLLLLALGLTGGLTFFILSERYRRLLLARQVLEQERRRLSRDLHDEVGATLTSLYFLLHTLPARQQRGEALSGRLRQAAELARTAIDQLRLLLWTTNPENDRLPVLIGYLRETVHQMAEAGGLQTRFTLPDHLPDLPIDAERRHHIVCIVREGMRNVLQHAQAHTVTLAVQLTDHHLRLRLCDDGRGFDPATVSHRGLRYMQERTARLQGTLAIDTRPGRGTCLCLDLPIPRTGD